MVQSDKAAFSLGVSSRDLESRAVVWAADLASMRAITRALAASRFGLFWIWAAWPESVAKQRVGYVVVEQHFLMKLVLTVFGLVDARERLKE